MEFEFSGTVADAETAALLRAVVVRCVGASGEVATTSSNRFGRWTITASEAPERIEFEAPGHIPHAVDSPSSVVDVRLLAGGFHVYLDTYTARPGQTVEGFVHSEEEFTVELHRYGREVDQVLSCGPFPAQAQSCDDDRISERGLNWQRSFEVELDRDIRPGLHSLQMLVGGTVRASFPLVVEPLEPGREPLLVLASTNTWLAYNPWGGRNRYRDAESGWQRPRPMRVHFRRGLANLAARFGLRTALRRAVRSVLKVFHKERGEFKEPDFAFPPLSSHRPMPVCPLEDSDPRAGYCSHLAAGEWRFLTWLEEKGYAYELISDRSADADPELFGKYRAVVLSTHSEYWSRRVFQGLKQANEEHGVSVLNFSGNSIYREIVNQPDGGMIPVGEMFCESAADESALLGVRFSSRGINTCAAFGMRSPASPFWEGMSNKPAEVFGKDSLLRSGFSQRQRYRPQYPASAFGLRGRGASGWETDKIAEGRENEFELLATGKNGRGSGADMVYRAKSDSRGMVFSASSISFTSCLLVDDACSGIAVRALDLTGISAEEVSS